VRRNIGYLPESVPLYSEMRVDEYVAFRAKLKGVARAQRPARIDYCLERCRLVGVRRRLLSTLSKGYRQRVGLADAMVNDPAIFILDEPTSGLDPQQIRETLALIKELGGRHTVLLSTHILQEVEAICERVVIIDKGQIGLDQRVEDIEANSAILIEVRGPGEQVGNVIRQTKGVVSVQGRPVEDGVTSFEIRTTQDEDLRETLYQAIQQKGWPIRKLDRKRRRVEDAFFDVLRAQDPLKQVGSARSEAITKKV
jgi:ABC-2 type transport system ATP-binding protein